jgi:hypothetical protein
MVLLLLLSKANHPHKKKVNLLQDIANGHFPWLAGWLANLYKAAGNNMGMPLVLHVWTLGV